MRVRGYTYFAQGEDGGPIKIGRTRLSPYSRLDALQTGSPVWLILVGVLVDARYEDVFHREFANDRIRGEWFAPTEILLSAIHAGEERQRDMAAARPFQRARFYLVVDCWADKLKQTSELESLAVWEEAKQAVWDALLEHLSTTDDEPYQDALRLLARLV
jgi:hypothetical protein